MTKKKQGYRCLEGLEARRMMSAAISTTVSTAISTSVSTSVSGIRSVDGSGNNLSHTDWGTPGSGLIRKAAPQFGDGFSTPAGANRPGAREISNQFLQQHLGEDIFNAEGMSAFVYAWGQFADHDMSLTNDAETPADVDNIPVPQGDVYFDPDYTGTQVIGFNRSQVVPGTGTGVGNPRQNPNSVTAFLDGSQVYGSDAARAAELRTFVGGKLKTSDNGTELPYNTDNFDNQTAGGPAGSYFLGGDVRANENSELTSINVLFVREHNRLATLEQKLHPRWTDEQIYQEARSLVIGEIEHITMDEFLPSIGITLPKYSGYKSNVNPQVSNEFSTAALRFGHSIVGDDVQFFDNDAQTTLPDQKVATTFFAPDQQLNGGTNGLLKYLSAVSSQENDGVIVNGIRNFLFGNPGQGGFDLGALDVQRGRDHGLADFNTTRAAMGLPKYTSFSQITDNPSIATNLQTVYGSVDNIDLFVGGLLEARAPGQVLGPTFKAILSDQFTRTRDGDRFWYQNSLSSLDLAYVQNITLSKLIKLDTPISNIQDNAFHFDVKVSGQIFNDVNGNGRFDANDKPLANTFLTISNPTGGDDGTSEVIGNTTTDSQGRYTLNKIQVGDYVVSAHPVGNWQSTTKENNMFAIHVNTDQQFTHNFGFRAVTATQSPPTPTPVEPLTADVAFSTFASRGGLNASKLIDSLDTI